MGVIIAKLLGTAKSFLAPYITYALLAAMIAVGSVAGVMWFQKHEAEKKVAHLTLENDRQKSEIDGLNSVVSSKESAIKELESTNATLNTNARETGARLKEIEDAPETDDGPIAPLLERTLRGLRHGPANAAH